MRIVCIYWFGGIASGVRHRRSTGYDALPKHEKRGLNVGQR